MNYPTALYLLILFACGCNRNEGMTKLLNEQKSLKDSANNISERIGSHMQNGVYDNAEAQKKQLEAIHARLIAIQSSIDSLATSK